MTQPRQPQVIIVQQQTPVPARTAHGSVYWVLVGWWWEPIKWLGRVSLWIIFLPVGLWRSIRHGRKNAERRMRRGANTSR